MIKYLLSAVVLGALTCSPCSASAAGLAPQSSAAQGVTITVTPADTSPTATVWNFEVVIETHTRPLDEDLAESSALVVAGKRFAPLGWSGSPPGGHHRKGSLRFAPVTPRPASIELVIRLSGEDAPRTFRWSLTEAGR